MISSSIAFRAQIAKQWFEGSNGNETFTTAEESELVAGGLIEQTRAHVKAKIPQGSDGDEPTLTAHRKRPCPKCGKQCLGVYRRWVQNEQGKRYFYWYAAHFIKGHMVRWCYVGKNRYGTARKPKTSR